jgi:hypothetical protein
MSLDLTDFKFLWWMRLTAFFPGDFEEEMLELGFDKDLISMLRWSEAFKKADLVQLYGDYGRGPKGEWFMTWINYNKKKYDDITATLREKGYDV